MFLLLLGIIGSWFVVWASVSFLNETRHTRRVMRSWEKQSKVVRMQDWRR